MGVKTKWLYYTVITHSYQCIYRRCVKLLPTSNSSIKPDFTDWTFKESKSDLNKMMKKKHFHSH